MASLLNSHGPVVSSLCCGGRNAVLQSGRLRAWQLKIPGRDRIFLGIGTRRKGGEWAWEKERKEEGKKIRIKRKEKRERKEEEW